MKIKRSYIRPIIAALKRFEVAAAEVGALQLHGRSEVGVAVVGADVAHVREVIEACERFMAARPETELLSVRRRIYGADDEA